MSEGVCGLCAKAVEADDYYRELDCSRKCRRNVFHELCVEKYLKKHGRNGGQKTGFGCPGIQPNGKPCPGTIKKTHVKVPMNAKKKEQNRQAAVAVNTLVNAARSAVPVQTSKGKDSAPQESRKAAAKLAKVTVVQRSLPQGDIAQLRKNYYPAVNPGHGGGIDGGFDDLSNFRPIGKWASKLDEDENAFESNVGIRPSTSDKELQIPIPHPGKKPAGNKTVASALSNNSAMAPEPVTRQHVIPGWIDPIKPDGGASNLQQQRALVAELRAKERMPSANRASVGTQRDARDGDPGSCRGEMAKAQTPAHVWKSSELDSPAGDIPGMSACDQGMSARQQATAISVIVNDSKDTLVHEGGPTTPAAGKPQEPCLRRSSSGGDGVFVTTTSGFLPSSELQQVPGGLDADPVVDYDQLFSTEDGTLIVLDKQSGFFLHMEDVYGQSPELIGFQDDAGNVTYYVVVRASVRWAQQQQAAAVAWAPTSDAGAAAAAGPASSVETAPDPDAAAAPGMAAPPLPYYSCKDAAESTSAEMTQDANTGRAGKAYGLGRPEVGAIRAEPEAGSDQGEQDDFDELLALCLR